MAKRAARVLPFIPRPSVRLAHKRPAQVVSLAEYRAAHPALLFDPRDWRAGQIVTLATGQRGRICRAFGGNSFVVSVAGSDIILPASLIERNAS